MPFFQRLVCCQTDENVYESDDSSSGKELGAGRAGATAAVIHWPETPSDHANFLSQGAGSIRVLPSRTRHPTSRHRKSDSVAMLPSKPPSKVPGHGIEEKEGEMPRALKDVTKSWAASLVSW